MPAGSGGKNLTGQLSTVSLAGGKMITRRGTHPTGTNARFDHPALLPGPADWNHWQRSRFRSVDRVFFKILRVQPGFQPRLTVSQFVARRKFGPLHEKVILIERKQIHETHMPLTRLKIH